MLPSNLRKRFSDDMSLDDVVREADRQGLPRLASGTQETYLTLKALFEFAQSQWLIERNPTLNLTAAPPEVHASRRKRPFSSQDFSQILLSREYLEAARDKLNMSPTSTRFWVTLLSAFCGMRVNEACQLYETDIQCSKGGVAFVSVNDEEDKSLKNVYSRRDIPIHPELLAIGFLKYVAVVRSKGSRRLFPDLRYHAKGNYGPDVSKWFNRMLPNWIADRERKSFHSFRHAFGDALRVIHVA